MRTGPVHTASLVAGRTQEPSGECRARTRPSWARPACCVLQTEEDYIPYPSVHEVTAGLPGPVLALSPEGIAEGVGMPQSSFPSRV